MVIMSSQYHLNAVMLPSPHQLRHSNHEQRVWLSAKMLTS